MDDKISILSNDIKSLRELLKEALKRGVHVKSISRSEKIDQLATALSLAQSNYEIVSVPSRNTYTDIAYASLHNVTKATRKALCDNGLSVVQVIFDHDDGSSVLHTQLLHNSDQFIESQMRIKPNVNEPASVTSYINWLKRIAYSAIVGCPIPKEDDDAEGYQAKQRSIPARGSASKRKDMTYEVVSKSQLEELEYELEGYPDTAEEILERYELQNIADLPYEKFRSVITKVRDIKLKLKKG